MNGERIDIIVDSQTAAWYRNADEKERARASAAVKAVASEGRMSRKGSVREMLRLREKISSLYTDDERRSVLQELGHPEAE